MLTLVIGGSGSGKSAYAETYVTNFFTDKKKYYIATMEVYDEEGRQRVERHRRQRLGKGFETLEVYRGLSSLSATFSKAERSVALLECMSNLVANEMYVQQEGSYLRRNTETVVRQICEDIRVLQERLDGMVIVSNNIFEDGVTYDASMREYRKALGMVNAYLADVADRVIEVVAGIPCVWKDCGGKL